MKNLYRYPKEKSKIESYQKNKKKIFKKFPIINRLIQIKNYIFDTYFNEVYVRDVWDSDSTKPLISGAKNTKYPTQKPEGLLKELLKHHLMKVI